MTAYGSQNALQAQTHILTGGNTWTVEAYRAASPSERSFPAETAPCCMTNWDQRSYALRRCLHIVDLQFCEERGSERRASQTIETNTPAHNRRRARYIPKTVLSRWAALSVLSFRDRKETNQCSDTCSTHNYKPANQRERSTWPALPPILCLKGHMTKSESLKILKQAS